MKAFVITSIIFSLPFLPLAGNPIPYSPENEEIAYEEQPVVAPQTEEALDEAAKQESEKAPVLEDQPSAKEILDPNKPDPLESPTEVDATSADEIHDVEQPDQADATEISNEVIAEKQEAKKNTRFNNILLGIGGTIVAIIAIALASSHNGRDASECNKEFPCAP